jgi:MATE family multidrug resistance protein
LIFGKFGFPAWGIAGAALGTIMGGAVGGGVLAAAYFRERNRREFGVGSSFRFDKPIMGKLLSFGSPAGWEMLLNLVAFNVLVMMFHSHSPVTATAATVMFNWDLVSFVPLVGIEIGVTSLVGRYMGARQPDIAHRAVMSGFKMGLVFSAVILILFVGFPRMLVMMFQPAGDDALFAAAVPLALFMLRLASLYVLVEAVLIVFIGALRGAGDTHWAMRISVALHWLMVLVLYVILRVLHLSPEAGWASIVVIFMVFSGVVYLRYHSGAWRKIRVVEHAEPEVPIMPPDTYHEQAEL